MNSSEIAERAAREIQQLIICDDCKTRGIPGTKKFNWPLCDSCLSEVAKAQPSSAPPAALGNCDKCGNELFDGQYSKICHKESCIGESGAAQEVSPASTKTIASASIGLETIGSVQEIRPRPDDPSCHVCGAQMVVKEWKCLSCKTTTGVEEVSPPSPEAKSSVDCQCSCNPFCGCACHKRKK